MTNPLKARPQESYGSTVPHGKDEWLAWCWERNERAIAAGWRNWLLVRDDGGSIRVEALSGAEEAFDAAGELTANRMVGVPYSDDMVASARADLVLGAPSEAPPGTRSMPIAATLPIWAASE